MKVYVDEFPIGAIEFGCDNCPYAEIQGINHYFINNEFVSYRDCVCKLDKTCGFKDGQKTCPLQSLADHDKQVRKEVFEQVKTELLDISHEYWRVFKQNGKQYMTSDDIAEYLDVILDQIQGKGE